MSPVAKSPTVLVADGDRWSADMLAQLVMAARCDARVLTCGSGNEALEQCGKHHPDLVIADYGLPGVDGIELLRTLRRSRRDPPVPFVVIRGKADANSVRSALPLQPTAYLTEPFEADRLLHRLRQLLIAPGEEVVCPLPDRPSSGLSQFLEQRIDEAEGAPMLQGLQQIVQRLNDPSTDLGNLEQVFSRDPQLTALLVAAANSSDRRRGSPCQTLAQALPRLGLTHSINLAVGLALQRTVQLETPLLAEQAGRFWQLSQLTAEAARWLAGQLRAEADRCYTAGLLHCLGDLTLLRQLQDWIVAGGPPLDLAQVETSLAGYSARFGGALRVRWRLPLELRQLIGAAWALGGGVYSREALIMNLAAQWARLPDRSDPSRLLEGKVARMLGVSPELLKRMPGVESPAQAPVTG